MQTRTDIKIRNFRWDDLPKLVALTNAGLERDNEEDRENLEEWEHDWHNPNFNPEVDCFIVTDNDDNPIAFGFSEKGTPLNRGFGWGAVHPDYRRQGLGSQLVRMADEHFLNTVLDKVEADKPIFMRRWVRAHDTATNTLMQSQGYNEVRRFYRMMIEFKEGEEIAQPQFPEGIEIRPFDRERDAHAVYQAQQESFRDHFGHMEDASFEEWENWMFPPDFDPTLWIIAYDGDEVAGVSLCRAWGPDQPDLGWLGSLGVRRPWRKRGLATALLLQTFHMFRNRGFNGVGLGVDAESRTNALALYERNGMHVRMTSIAYRKVLRGNEADIHE